MPSGYQDNISVSPGVKKLLSPNLIEAIWNVYSEHPNLLPSLFDLDRGRGYQKVTHVCLLPWHWQVHRIVSLTIVEGLRLVLYREQDGSLTLRIRNRGLEEILAESKPDFVQGELFTDTET